MSERSGSARRGNRRRPVEVAKKLQARQDGRIALRTDARERRRRIETAEREFTDAWERIEAITADTDAQVAALEERIRAVREQAAEAIAVEQIKQADAAVAVRAEVRNTEEVAEELQIPLAAARQLLARAASQPSGTDPDPARNKPGRRPTPPHAGDHAGPDISGAQETQTQRLEHDTTTEGQNGTPHPAPATASADA